MTDDRRAYPAILSDEEEVEYLLRRAKDHRRLAEQFRQSATSSVHRRLQKLYEQRIREIANS
jgi:hypothetical protein